MEQIVGRVGRMTHGDAGAHGERRAAGCEDAGGVDGGPHAFGDLDRARERRVLEDDDEFFAAVACREIAAATDGIRDRLADRVQRHIACLMTERVVVELEAVDVDDGERQRTVAPSRAAERASKLLIEATPVR